MGQTSYLLGFTLLCLITRENFPLAATSRLITPTVVRLTNPAITQNKYISSPLYSRELLNHWLWEANNTRTEGSRSLQKYYFLFPFCHSETHEMHRHSALVRHKGHSTSLRVGAPELVKDLSKYFVRRREARVEGSGVLRFNLVGSEMSPAHHWPATNVRTIRVSVTVVSISHRLISRYVVVN